MQLSGSKTYRTRDGSRTGIRVRPVTPQNRGPYTWQAVPSGEGYLPDGRAWRHASEHREDLIEETPASPPPFSYDACPIGEDGRRRAVTIGRQDVILFADDAPGDHSIVGVIKIGDDWNACGWKANGMRCGTVTGTDLVIPPAPNRSVWVNLYEGGVAPHYPTQEEADAADKAREFTAPRLGNRAHRIEIGGEG